MQRHLAAALLTVIGLGCGGQNYGGEPGTVDDPNDPLICIGDPDSDMLCRKASEFWDCTAMPNGDKKCVYKDAQVPDGTSWTTGGSSSVGGTAPAGSGTWTCTQVGTKIVCTSSTAGASVPAGSGWVCKTALGKTTCEKEGPLPPGGGTWNCTLQEFTWTCTGNGPVGGSTGGAGTSGTGGSGITGATPGGSGTSGSGGSGAGESFGGGGSWTGVGGSSGPGGGTPSGPSGPSTPGGPGGPATGGSGVCTQWYAVKWGIGGSSAGSCEGIPGNDQDCDSIKALLSGGLPGPLHQGTCSVVPVKQGSTWVITLPAGCQFLQGGVCGKYGGNTFVVGSGTTTISIPAQQGTGLSHFEFMWCC